MTSHRIATVEGAPTAIGLFVFAVVCAITFGEVSAQVATFTTQQYPLLGNTHIGADLNSDGKADLVGAGGNAVSVMLGNGDGMFGTKTDFPIGMQTQAVAAGDFNSDGKADLMVTLDSPQLSLALLTGTGAGTFNAASFFPNTSGFDSPAIAATDLNGDSKLDLVVMITSTGQLIGTLSSQGGGTVPRRILMACQSAEHHRSEQFRRPGNAHSHRQVSLSGGSLDPF